MRVMQVLYSLSIGGSEMVGKNLAFKLSDRGHDVQVAALEFGGELEHEFVSKNINFHIIGREPNEYVAPMIRLLKVFAKFKPDIVHTHHLHNLVYAAIPAKLVGAKTIHTEHEYFSLSAKKHRFYLKLLSLLCSHVTGVGHEITEFLRTEVKLPPNKLTTVTNGIDIASFGKDRKKARERYNISPTDKVIGIVARLGKEKDHATLLQSFSNLHKTDPNILLLIVGDGEERDNLQMICHELEIAERVKFVGASSDIPNLLAAMDVFVLSSRAEGLPLAMLEAMAASLPVVVTRVGAIPEVIGNDNAGLLTIPGNASDIANKLRQVISNPDLAKKIATRGNRLVKEQYGLNVMVDRYVGLYNHCLGIT